MPEIKNFIDQNLTDAVRLAEENMDKAKSKQARRPPQGIVVQTLILSKKKFKSMSEARKWVREHGFKTRHKGKGPDETSGSFRFRQRDPGDFKRGTFRTFRLSDGVQAVGGRLKGRG